MRYWSAVCLLLGLGLASYDLFLDRDDSARLAIEVTAAEDGTGFPPPKP